MTATVSPGYIRLRNAQAHTLSSIHICKEGLRQARKEYMISHDTDATGIAYWYGRIQFWARELEASRREYATITREMYDA